jgi:hypothetical protein
MEHYYIAYWEHVRLSSVSKNVKAVGALDRDTGPPVQQQQLRQQGIILLVCSGVLADTID